MADQIQNLQLVVAAQPIFHLFLSLPKEIQMLIWEEAFRAEDPLNLRGNLRNFIGNSARPRMLLQSPYSDKQVYFHLGGAHCGLVAKACRMSRLVAFRYWRGLVESAETDDSRNSYMQTKKQRKVLWILGGLTDQIEDRWEEDQAAQAQAAVQAAPAAPVVPVVQVAGLIEYNVQQPDHNITEVEDEVVEEEAFPIPEVEQLEGFAEFPVQVQAEEVVEEDEQAKDNAGDDVEMSDWVHDVYEY